MKTWLTFLMIASSCFLLHCNTGNEKDSQTQDEAKKQKKVTKQSPDTVKDWDSLPLRKRGKQIVKASAQSLKNHLTQAISQGGFEKAIQYCSHKAMPLTDSLSKAYDVKIGRVSHKNRNPSNAASALEMKLIRTYQKQNKQGKALESLIVAKKDKNIYYHPITIKNDLCLNCHGQKQKDIKVENYITIQNLYPNDKATGFSLGDVRGMWKVQFGKKSL